ncbi:MAG: dihydroorotase [Bacteroidetes bacterium]|nr:dihydroorotase [Bacteroidota bacterium]MBU1719408.1 dihydroorotase [Bacteroidota bacterium]
MKGWLIQNAKLVNENRISDADILITGQIIEKIAAANTIELPSGYQLIDATGYHLFPGIIDDQVHFREPGLTYKADIASESKAAVAGGVTSFMDMPNTKPASLSMDLLNQRFEIAANCSVANYSFYLGASNENIAELRNVDHRKVCGIKVFMGSSTGNMLVDDEKSLSAIFAESPILVATHCEDQYRIRANTEEALRLFGENIPPGHHPIIRSAEACYQSSAIAVELALKYNTRLHVLHLTTARELGLFNASTPLCEKRITAEVCVHHLYFDSQDYNHLGNLIKCNPAIKNSSDRIGLLHGVSENRIDVIASDHAPHTWEEKQKKYSECPSGLPLVQFSFPVMAELYHSGTITLERITEKMCHSPAICFGIENRGFVREGYYADLFLCKLHQPYEISKPIILSKCGWSPFENMIFRTLVTHTFVNGNLVFENGVVSDQYTGSELIFNR